MIDKQTLFRIFTETNKKLKLETIKDHYPEINTKQSGGKFDVEIIPIIHNSFKKYDIEIITNAGFWRWLSTYAYDGWFYELIEWRYKFSDDTIVDQINWGIGNDNLIIEFYFYRNWLRGEIGYDEDRKNRYELAQLGDIDFWRSHILRQEYGRDRNFVKALLIILFHEKKYSFSIKTIRQELVPQIRSWYATGSFTHLNHNDCYEVVCEICDSIS